MSYADQTCLRLLSGPLDLSGTFYYVSLKGHQFSNKKVQTKGAIECLKKLIKSTDMKLQVQFLIICSIIS